MRYYSHHIGDFDRATRHLTRIERSIYRDLIELYYESETQIPLDLAMLCRKIVARSEEEKAAVLAVLDEFFHETPTGWYHDRCEEELAEYRKTKSQASAAGKASAAARAERRLAAMGQNPTETERRSNENPTTVQRPFNDRSTGGQQNVNELATNQEPVTSNHTNTPHTPQGGQAEKKVKGKDGAIGLPAYLAQCKLAGTKPIPDECAVFDYADKAGISQEFLRLQWMEFRDRYSMEGAKRYKAWPTVFTKSVRGNWFKLWFVDANGQYVLTTAGIQARNTHQGKAA